MLCGLGLVVLARTAPSQDIKFQVPTPVDSSHLTPADRQELAAILAGIPQSLNQIHSGHVRFAERRTSGAKATELHHEQWFDDGYQLILSSTEKGIDRTVFGRNGEESFTAQARVGGPGIVSVRLPAERPTAHEARPLDVRSLPIGGPFLISVRWSLDELWKTIQASLTVDRARSYLKRADGTVEIVVQPPIPDTEKPRSSWMRLVLDRNAGGAPVLIEQWSLAAGAAEPALDWRSTTHWQAMGGTWVPVLWRAEDPPSQQVNIQLEWSTVNTPIVSERFEAAALDMPRGTPIWDHRLGHAILREKIGYPGVARRASFSRVEPPRSHVRTWILVANVALILTFLIVTVVRRRRTRRESP
jgi:hypothetical protein